jgi:hypothetical protein
MVHLQAFYEYYRLALLILTQTSLSHSLIHANQEYSRATPPTLLFVVFVSSAIQATFIYESVLVPSFLLYTTCHTGTRSALDRGLQ